MTALNEGMCMVSKCQGDFLVFIFVCFLKHVFGVQVSLGKAD